MKPDGQAGEIVPIGHRDHRPDGEISERLINVLTMFMPVACLIWWLAWASEGWFPSNVLVALVAMGFSLFLPLGLKAGVIVALLAVIDGRSWSRLFRLVLNGMFCAMLWLDMVPRCPTRAEWVWYQHREQFEAVATALRRGQPPRPGPLANVSFSVGGGYVTAFVRPLDNKLLVYSPEGEPPLGRWSGSSVGYSLEKQLDDHWYLVDRHP